MADDNYSNASKHNWVKLSLLIQATRASVPKAWRTLAAIKQVGTTN